MTAASSTGVWIRLGGSVVLAGLLLYALAPYLDAIPSQFVIAWWTVPAYLAVLVLYNVFRSARWLLLLEPLGKVPTGVGLRVGFAGAMWIALLPFRLGELARPLMLAQTTDVTMRRALGSIAVERVVDGLVICGLFFATASGLSGGEMSRLHAATSVVMGAFASALVTLAWMARFPTAASRIIHATLGRLAPKLTPAVAQTARAVSEGLAALPNRRTLLGFAAMTALYWGANAFGMWVLAQGCGLALSLPATVTVMAVINIALLVPGGPAQVGIFHAGVTLGLGLFIPAAAVKAEGSTYVFLLYLCQLGSIVAFGLWAQRSLGLSWRTILRPTSEPDPTPVPSDPVYPPSRPAK